MAVAEPPADADAVTRGVAVFVELMMSDPLLSWAFEGVDDAGIQKHALAFVIAALGGPDLYVGRGMREVHAPFALRNEHFDVAVAHLVTALGEAGISSDVVANLAVRLEPLRGQIVTAL